MTIGQRRRGVGVEVLPDGSVHARVWAPYARTVAVVFEDASGTHPEPVTLTAEERGYFSGFLPTTGPGTRYRLRLDDQTLVADPASRLQPEGVYGASMVVDPAAFAWEVDAWQVPPFRDWVLYELHVGTFTPEGTFDAVIRACRTKDLGVTAIELMPVAQFPGARNWGYDGVFPYAVQDSYGGPEACGAWSMPRTRRAGGDPGRGLQPPGTRRQLPPPVRPLLHRPLPHALGRRRQFRRRRTATRCAHSSSTTR